MDELDLEIIKICDEDNIMESQISVVRNFITNCSLSDFEKLKEMDWEQSQNEGS